MVDNITPSQDSRENRDKLFKVRPMVDHLREKFKQLTKDQELCIDEQMVPFKGRSSLKQYVPNKPHRHLAHRDIWCCGTVRQARMSGIKKGMADEKQLMKKGRGAYEALMSTKFMRV
ncbi:hypothetical protein Pcinc_009162 [Petrolisthes cinctipes]|uniref:PiggyBac transposable element-derived protein domain-containing protein n=1 Tax=Petrolisthes cinctipes TaxID=88211 RepID=A0AAE1G7X6_PETCI|nr:hypothetical protein Pcinc_009162 [Petrolisthes cinctipes]